MKLVICDHPATLRRGTEYEVSRLKSAFPEAEVIVHPYSDQRALLRELADADGCITGFLHLGEDVFSNCPRLKAVSIDATGFNTIDLEAARRHGVTVCAVRDYCTEEVAEHTMALMLAVTRKLKVHQYRLEKDGVWAYKLAAPVYRLSGRTLAVFGFGRIGQAVARRAQAFGLNVLVVSAHLSADEAKLFGVLPVSREEAAEQADIITNHMKVSNETISYFNDHFFQGVKRQPFFLNVGRGTSVDEGALLRALDAGLISGAGLDVLQEEQPDPRANPLFGREDVVITPHAAFYSEQSMRALQDISCDNLIAMLRGTPELANYVVSG